MPLTCSQTRALEALKKFGPMTKAELADKCFVALGTLRKGKTLEPLAKQNLVHVCLVLNKAGVHEHVWAAGCENSVPEVVMERLKKRYARRFEEKHKK